MRAADDQQILIERRNGSAPYDGPERRSHSTGGVAAARSHSDLTHQHRVPVSAALVDAGIVLCSLLAGMWSWLHWFNGPFSEIDDQILFAVCTLPSWIVVFAWQRFYVDRDDSRMFADVLRVANAVGIGALGYILLAWPINLEIPRATVGIAVMLMVLALLTERQAIRMWVRRRRRKGVGLRPVAIMGANCEAMKLAETLSNPTLGRRVVGFITNDREIPNQLCGVEVRYSSDPAATASNLGVQSVVIAATALDGSVPPELLRSFLDRGIDIEMTSAFTGVANDRIHIHTLGPYPLIAIDPGYRGGWRALAKRAFDVAVASSALVVLSPFIAIAALAVRIEDGGPVMFSQDRLGHRGRRFRVHKIRTMVVDAEDQLIDLRDRNEADGPLFKMEKDPRVTRVGHVLRKYSIDELPQLWNVVKGEMSLVGPRPAIAQEAEGWSAELHNRLRVRPGMTGMWQVSGRSDAAFSEYERLDLFYIDNWSMLTDLGILARTVPAVISRKGAS